MGRKIGTSASGIVHLEEVDGRLRLRWTYDGERYPLNLKLPDSKANRSVALAKANRIESEIIHEIFDPTLERYQPQRVERCVERSTQISLSKVFERFWQDKQKSVCSSTYENYRAAVKWLNTFLKNEHVKIRSITLDVADDFTEWLQQQALKDITRKTYLTLLKAIWDWAKSEELVDSNPWPRMVKRIQVDHEAPNPFMAAERNAIITGFRNSQYAWYGDYVEFLFLSGGVCHLCDE